MFPPVHSRCSRLSIPDVLACPFPMFPPVHSRCSRLSIPDVPACPFPMFPPVMPQRSRLSCPTLPPVMPNMPACPFPTFPPVLPDVLPLSFPTFLIGNPERESSTSSSRPRLMAALPGIGGFNESIQHVRRGALNAVAQQKLLTAGEPLHPGHQPEKKAIMRFQCRTRSPGTILGKDLRRDAFFEIPSGSHTSCAGRLMESDHSRRPLKTEPGGSAPGPPQEGTPSRLTA